MSSPDDPAAEPADAVEPSGPDGLGAPPPAAPSAAGGPIPAGLPAGGPPQGGHAPGGYPTGGYPAGGYPGGGYPGAAPGPARSATYGVPLPPQPYPSGSYGAPPPAAPYPSYSPWGPTVPLGPTNGMAVTSMVLGIISIVLCWALGVGIVLGILALIFGAAGLQRVRQGWSGRGQAIAGIATGAVGVVLSTVIFVIQLVAIVDDVDCGSSNLTRSQQINCAYYGNPYGD